MHKKLIYLKKVDILTKDQKNTKIFNDFRNFDKMELFALIAFNTTEVKSKEDLKKFKISYVDALKYMKVIYKNLMKL